MKNFVLIVKVLIVVSFFVIANITKIANIEVANAIAGVMTIGTIAMYVVESLNKK